MYFSLRRTHLKSTIKQLLSTAWVAKHVTLEG